MTSAQSGWACGGSGQGYEKCAGWNSSSRKDKEQAVKDCNACDDCHGMFASGLHAEQVAHGWHYCSKSWGVLHNRGKWHGYTAIFKKCSGSSNDLCYNQNQGGAQGHANCLDGSASASSGS